MASKEIGIIYAISGENNMNLFNLSKDQETEINKLLSWCTSYWDDMKVKHRHYTIHGIQHSKKIIEKLEEWLDKNIKLNEKESFILLGSIYLHDIGMQCSDEYLLKDIKVNIPSPDRIDNSDELELIRKNHAFLSSELIKNMMNPNITRLQFQIVV